jgi:hypothetical protein
MRICSWSAPAATAASQGSCSDRSVSNAHATRTARSQSSGRPASRKRVSALPRLRV